MTIVLAAVEADATADTVLAAGAVAAELFHASLHALHVRENGRAASTAGVAAAAARAGATLRVADGDPVTEIVDAVADPDVALAVVGTRSGPEGPRPAGHIALAVVERADKPVMVVPPESVTRDVAPRIRRALVPLEGTVATTEAVTAAIHQLVGAGVDLVALHVFDAATVPRFWDEPAHAEESFAAEFLWRWCAEPNAHLLVRRGTTPAAMIEAADSGHIDLIVLGWGQNLGAGHAHIVRAALTDAHVPVLLVPLSGPDATTGRTSR
jgi:nucleotide-binding universal stress UspA family protein